MSEHKPHPIYLKDYQPPSYFIDSVSLTVSIYEKHTDVISVLSIRKNPDAVKQEPLVLDGDGPELKSIKLNDKPLPESSYKLEGNKLVIPKIPSECELTIEVIIKPHENTSLSGLYVSKNNYCTQCESHGFRRITYYIDRPDVMAKFTTRIEANKHAYPDLLSNGNPIEKGNIGIDRHYVVWEDPFKKPSYLFALVVGDYACERDTFVTMSGRQIDLQLYLEKQNAGKGAYALHALKEAMAWDEENYGREYDLDIYIIVAVSDFNMGAMENKGLNIFNDKYILADEKIATDMDYQNILAVVGHEYFHNWSGNRVTLRDWFQLSLKEGFTVFREQQFAQDKTSKAIRRIEEVSRIKHAQFVEDSGPMSHPVRPHSYIEMNNFYTATVYSKGAEVIGMLHTLLGEDHFRDACDRYFSRFDGAAATVEDFIACMQDASQHDLTQFKRWYDQSGTPIVSVNWDYDERHHQLNMTFQQYTEPTADQQEKQDLHIPIRMALIGSNGKIIGHDHVFSLTQSKQTSTINCNERSTPSLLRGFSAPVKLKANYIPDELLFLAVNDDDPVARFDAQQALAIHEILYLMDERPKKITSKRLSTLFSALLDDDATDPALLAYLLQLPSENYLAEQRKPVLVDDIIQVRAQLRKTLAIEHAKAFKQHYTSLQQNNYQIDQHAIAQRAFRNTCLHYLVATEFPEHINLAEDHYYKANNMTDRLGALKALNDHDGDIRKSCLTDFYERWEGEPLVIDKWFALEATSRSDDTIQHVEQLAKHPAFSYHNPNRVYSLFAQFGHHNFQYFHENTGRGYNLIANAVMKLDAINPQVAAQVIRPLISYRQYPAERQALMRGALLQIREKANLSPDVYEIVDKSL